MVAGRVAAAGGARLSRSSLQDPARGGLRQGPRRRRGWRCCWLQKRQTERRETEEHYQLGDVSGTREMGLQKSRYSLSIVRKAAGPQVLAGLAVRNRGRTTEYGQRRCEPEEVASGRASFPSAKPFCPVPASVAGARQAPHAIR
ncbi:uncharacterized protein M6G45_013971 [Spheniscus humboldti]